MQKLSQIGEWISSARVLVVTAGAGMGVDSGMPDFRSTNGFWQAYPALAEGRIGFQEMATSGQFRRDPQRAWGFYGHRLNLYRATEPHEGFRYLKAWGDAMPDGYFVYTSNVDGHFQKAGFAEDRIFECHGSIHVLQCLAHCSDLLWPADGFVPEVDVETCRLLNPLPRCPKCSGVARPNILMFEDYSWNTHRSDRQHWRMDDWLDQVGVERGGVVVLEIGAGRALPAVRGFSERMKKRGAQLVRVNLNEANDVLTPNHIELAMGAKDALSQIARLLPGASD